MNIVWITLLVFVENFEDIFEGLGQIKRPLRTYNNEVLDTFINISLHVFFSLSLYYVMPSTVPSVHLLEERKKSTSFLYQDDVSIMAYVVD